MSRCLMRTRQWLLFAILLVSGFTIACAIYQMYIQDLRHELATVRFELRDVRNELLFVKLQAASSSDGGDAGGPNGKKTANKQRKRSAFDLYLGARRMPTIPASELFNWTAVDESIHFGTDEERLAVHQVLGAFHEKPCCVRDAEFLIRYAAATYLLGQAEVYGAGPDGKLRKRTSAGEEARLKIITVANATIYRAVEVAPQNGRAQCWLGVIMGTFGELLDINTRVRMGFKCKDYMVKGIELEPSYIFTHYALGRWYYEVATVPWIQKQICNTFFGQVPDASLADAMEQLEEADRLLRDQRGPNARSKDIVLYRAKILLADEDEAKQRQGARLLLEADALPTRNVEDRVCERALSQLLPTYRHLAT